MLPSRPRCSMYVVAAVYGLTFLFKATGIPGTGQRRLDTLQIRPRRRSNSRAGN